MARINGRNWQGPCSLSIVACRTNHEEDCSLYKAIFAMGKDEVEMEAIYNVVEPYNDHFGVMEIARAFCDAEFLLAPTTIGTQPTQVVNHPHTLYITTDWLRIVMWANSKLRRVAIHAYMIDSCHLATYRLVGFNADIADVVAFGQCLESEIKKACPRWWSDYNAPG